MLRTLSFGELTTGLIVEHAGEFIQAESMTKFDKIYGHKWLDSRQHLHVLIVFYICMHAKSLQLCPTLCDPMDYSPPGSSVHGISQARILLLLLLLLLLLSCFSCVQLCATP